MRQFTQQKIFGSILFFIVTLVLCLNIVYFFIQPDEGLEKNFFSPNIIGLMFLLIPILISLLWDSVIAKYIQCLILYIMAGIAVFINIEQFWGWGLYFMALSVGYSYDLLSTHSRIKIWVSLFLLICVGAAGKWYSERSISESLFSFIACFFFILMGYTVYLLIVKRDSTIKQLKDTITSQDVIISKLTESLKPLECWKVSKLAQQGSVEKLTDMEQQIFIAFCQNQGKLSNKELSVILDIKPTTLNSAFQRMMKKLGVNSRAELLVKYLEINSNL